MAESRRPRAGRHRSARPRAGRRRSARPRAGRRRSGRPRVGPVRLALAGLLCAVAVVAGAWSISGYVIEQSYPKDMRGTPVVLPRPSAAVLARTAAVSQVRGSVLRVPATGLNVPLGELNEVDGVIDPPGFSSAYLVRNYGADPTHAASGTVFVVMHSCRGGAVCPGNYLIDVSAGATSLKPGDDVYVAGLHYRITGSEKVYKPDVRASTEIWADVPGRLVLLTCLQVPDQTQSTDNLVVTAQLVPAPVSE